MSSTMTPPRASEIADAVEYYFEQAWSDGLPVVPPTPAKIAAVVDALGGEPDFPEAVIPPRGGALPGDLDKSTLGHPGKYTYCIAENEELSPWAPYHVEHGFAPDDSTVFVIAAEPPHSVVNHVANDAQGVLDSIVSAMSTFAHNNAVASGSCAVVIGPEHAATIAASGFSRLDVRSYLWMNAGNTWGEISFNDRYAGGGKVYNKALPA